jgi:hypothetical protein
VFILFFILSLLCCPVADCLLLKDLPDFVIHGYLVEVVSICVST